jgi:hypothetical protein
MTHVQPCLQCGFWQLSAAAAVHDLLFWLLLVSCLLCQWCMFIHCVAVSCLVLSSCKDVCGGKGGAGAAPPHGNCRRQCSIQTR